MASPGNHCHWRNHLHFTSDYVINYFRRCWPCMLLPREMANKMSIVIRKGTKYYPRILENQSAWNTVCSSNYFTWRKMRWKWQRHKKLSATIRGMGRTDDVTLYVSVFLKETINGIHQFSKYKESLATSSWKGNLKAWKRGALTSVLRLDLC